MLVVSANNVRYSLVYFVSLSQNEWPVMQVNDRVAIKKSTMLYVTFDMRHRVTLYIVERELH